MITFTLSFISGIILYHYFWFFPGTITLACIVLLFILIKRFSGRVQLALLFCFFLGGFLRAYYYDAALSQIPIVQGRASFSGIVAVIPEKYDEYQSFVLDKVLIDELPIQGKVRLSAPLSFSISIGDYILTGGEIPAMVLTDSITRLIPGVGH